MVNGLAFRLIGRDSDLDDLVQESFVQAIGSLARLRSGETFAAWMSAIVVRTAHKLLRRRRLMTELGLLRREAVDFEAIISRDTPQDVAFELRVLYGLVERMPPELRIPLLLRHVEDASLEEIAELTGVSLATVKRRLVKAQANLDQALERERGKHAER
jgi:RNA polymerase sigma-70 factor (ECF subfamily)